jgi:hypothetical protein
MGRKTVYRKEFDELARNYCLLGATNDELAEFFGVTARTIENWAKAHKTFFRSLKEGKAIADGQIANSLFHRARGYSHPDVHITSYKGEITETPVTKHYPPDATACIFWLKNRRPDMWRDVQRVEGKMDHDYQHAHEAISRTEQWLREVVEQGKDSEPPESVSH